MLYTDACHPGSRSRSRLPSWYASRRSRQTCGSFSQLDARSPHSGPHLPGVRGRARSVQAATTDNIRRGLPAAAAGPHLHGAGHRPRADEQPYVGRRRAPLRRQRARHLRSRAAIPGPHSAARRRRRTPRQSRRSEPARSARSPAPSRFTSIPYAWADAPWWSDDQVLQPRARSSMRLKRLYNVDENRVVVSGVSDGGTGAYYVAMRETTPFASFLPLNGYLMVLAQRDIDDGDDLREQPAQQAAVHRQRRPRSAVSDARRRSVHRALKTRRRRARLSSAARGRAQHRVVARGQGRVRSVRPRRIRASRCPTR